MALLTGISISQRLAFHSLKESLEPHAVQHSLLLAHWTHYGFSMWYHAHYSHRVYTGETTTTTTTFFSFTARHRKSFYNNRNEIKKGKKKSNKNCLNINNNFGIIQKRHSLVSYMPFDVKKHFLYFYDDFVGTIKQLFVIREFNLNIATTMTKLIIFDGFFFSIRQFLIMIISWQFCKITHNFSSLNS